MIDLHILSAATVLQRGKYKIVRELGHGSFGITYLAKTRVKMAGVLSEMETEIDVAIKEFFMSDINTRAHDGTSVEGSSGSVFTNYRRKFRKEAENLARLSHDNIVRVIDVFDENNTTYYVMQYVEGGSLDEYIAARGRLSEQETFTVLRNTGDALRYMHSHKMLHLDLKPRNIMRRASDGHIFLIDFGLSKHFTDNGEPESSTTVGHGTPGYAPLEQAKYRGDGSFPATLDVYALGATAFKMLTGKRPPEASDILNDGFPSADLLSAGVSRLTVECIERAMSAGRRQRYQTVDAFLSALGCADRSAGYDSEETDFKEAVSRTSAREVPTPVSEHTPRPVMPTPAAQPYKSVLPPEPEPSFFVRHKGLVAMICVAVFAVIGFMLFRRGDDTGKLVNDHDYVDLGLSVMWATCNVGADSPSDHGDYFAWGETAPKSEYTEDNCKNNSKYLGDISGNPQYDAASANWGGSWRIPTHKEMRELVDQCDWVWTTQNGHNGYKVTSKINGNSIFLPAAGGYGESLVEMEEWGYYWTSKSDEDGPCHLHFANDDLGTGWSPYFAGQCVRPVFDKPANTDNTQTRIAEDKRQQEEAEQARLAEEKRKQQEAEQARLAEQKRQQQEAEQTRLAEEKRKQEEAEQARLAEERRKQEESERQKSVTGSIAGHDYVDLGLSVKWATCNVGASSPSDYGNYYSWGYTKPYQSNDDEKIYGKDMGDIAGNYTYDAARNNWGGSWRLPTRNECQELIDKCTWTWTTQGGHNGYKVTSKTNGNSIFLPAAGWCYRSSCYLVGDGGYYHSSTPHERYTESAYILSFYEYLGVTRASRSSGGSVRPVSK